MSRDALREELAQRNDEHGTDWYVLVNDEQAWELAHGFVCHEVKAMVRTMLEWRAQDDAAAERHSKPQTRKPRTRRAPRDAPTPRGGDTMKKKKKGKPFVLRPTCGRP